jgi:hypothetical protein
LGYSNWVVHGVLLIGSSACGGEEAARGPSGGGGSAGSAGAPTSGVAGASSGGAGALAGSGPTGGAAVASGACGGPYGAAAPFLQEDAPTFVISGISLTADELEIFYARNEAADPVTPPVVVRRSRANKDAMFGAIEPLTMLGGVCGTKLKVNPDISEDGLTLYVTCTDRVEDPSLSPGKSVLRVARRADRTSPFVLASEPVGDVYASAGLSADQLTAYTDGEFYDTPPRMFVRQSEHENFAGAGQTIPGITTPLRSPDISASGLQLFGAAVALGATVSSIHRFSRPSSDTPFGAPELLELGLPDPPPSVGGANVTPSCALYLIGAASNTPYTVYRALPK